MPHQHYQQVGFVLMLIRVQVKPGHHHRYQRYELIIPPNERTAIVANVNVTVGHTVSMTLVFLDQNGNPMLTAVTPDAVPTWSDTTPATGTLTVGANGLSATELAIAAGADVVNVALAVGGVSFAASLGITVAAAPQVLTSVQINATVS